jgi:hypothetical protein
VLPENGSITISRPVVGSYLSELPYGSEELINSHYGTQFGTVIHSNSDTFIIDFLNPTFDL